MAISAEAIARAFNQALGMVSAERAADRARGRPSPGVGVSAIARRLYDANRGVTGANYSSYAAVARRAAASVRLAEQMNAQPARAPTRSEVPEVPTLYASADRYRYHVVATYTGRGGREVHIRGEVVSDVPLSGAQVDARVRERLDYSDSPSRATKRAVRNLGPSPTIASIEILAATRTY